MKTIVASYVRVSTLDQAENGNSIQEQTERIQKYCDALGWTIYKTYTDAGFSGGNTNRPALQALLADARSHKIEKVVVYKLDRLSRSQKDTLEIIEDDLLKNGVDFVSMSENFDTSSPFGRAMIGILAVFAQLEREQIKERMQMGREAIAKQGKYNGGHYIPVGYRLENGDYAVNEFEAAQVREIFRLVLDGWGLTKIAKYLNARGMLRSGKPWTRENVGLALDQRAYIGYKKFGKKWHKAEHPAILDEMTFFAVQKVIEERKQDFAKYNSHPGKASSYLGGLLRCARCGEKYAICRSYSRKTAEAKYYYYKCNTRANRTKAKGKCDNKIWKTEELESLVFAEIRKLALEPDLVEVIAPKREKISVLQAEIEKINLQISRLLDLYTVGGLPLDDLQRRVEAANDQKEQLENEILRARRETERRADKEEARTLALSLSDALDRGTFEEIRAIVTGLIERIEIDGADITIFWRF